MHFEGVTSRLGCVLIAVQDRFPPHIYYKVFTHRPVQDIGAFSPCDYTSSDFRKQTARDIHNKTPPRKCVQSKRSCELFCC